MGRKRVTQASEHQPTVSPIKLRRSQRDPKAAKAAAREQAEATEAELNPNWSGWSSGETELAAVNRAGRWPDGQKIGRGHGQPYLQPQYAHAMRRLAKTVEGRPGTGWAANVKANDWITFKITASGGKKLVVRATRVRHFSTFEAMLKECGVEACLPGLEGGLDEAVHIYRSFGTFSGASYADIEAESGAIAIDVVPLRPAQDQ